MKLPNAVPKPKPRAKRKPSGPHPLKRSRLKARGKRSKKSGGQLFHGAKFRDPKFLEFVRSQPCILRDRWYYAGGDCTFANCDCVIYHVCPGPVRACHVKSRGAGGPDKANVYAGCDAAHDAQGMLGIPEFERRWNVDLRAEALRLQALYERTVTP